VRKQNLQLKMPSDPEKPKDNSSSAEKADLTNAMAESIEKELFDEPATTTTGTEPHRVEASASEPTEEKPAGIVVETKETDEKKDAHDVSEPDKTAAAAENTGEDKKEIGTGKQTQTQHDQGIGDRNPIEAEMAKILDELGGQPKQ
jgi:flagellar protein FliO/FliZ